MLEALLWIGLPLSPRELVNVLDGDISMWDAAYHLRVLETFGVVKPAPLTTDEPEQSDGFDEPYRLRENEDNDDNRQDD